MLVMTAEKHLVVMTFVCLDCTSTKQKTDSLHEDIKCGELMFPNWRKVSSSLEKALTIGLLPPYAPNNPVGCGVTWDSWSTLKQDLHVFAEKSFDSPLFAVE